MDEDQKSRPSTPLSNRSNIASRIKKEHTRAKYNLKPSTLRQSRSHVSTTSSSGRYRGPNTHSYDDKHTFKRSETQSWKQGPIKAVHPRTVEQIKAYRCGKNIFENYIDDKPQISNVRSTNSPFHENNASKYDETYQPSRSHESDNRRPTMTTQARNPHVVINSFQTRDQGRLFQLSRTIHPKKFNTLSQKDSSNYTSQNQTAESYLDVTKISGHEERRDSTRSEIPEIEESTAVQSDNIHVGPITSQTEKPEPLKSNDRFSRETKIVNNCHKSSYSELRKMTGENILGAGFAPPESVIPIAGLGDEYCQQNKLSNVNSGETQKRSNILKVGIKENNRISQPQDTAIKGQKESSNKPTDSMENKYSSSNNTSTTDSSTSAEQRRAGKTMLNDSVPLTSAANHNDVDQKISEEQVRKPKTQTVPEGRQVNSSSFGKINKNVEVERHVTEPMPEICSIAQSQAIDERSQKVPKSLELQTDKMKQENIRAPTTKKEQLNSHNTLNSTSKQLSKGSNSSDVQRRKVTFLENECQCSTEKGIKIYRPLRAKTNGEGKVHIGVKRDLHMEKVLLLVGETGSGKTTWINGLFNYIHGMEWTDDARVKLIEENRPGSVQNQAESQTKKVTPYTIHYQPWFKAPFGITVIDTPGFGDTEGIQRDKEITEDIKRFFTTNAQDGIDHLDAIGFVIQSSLPRLTHIQRYIFDSILSLFGRDVADNIFLLLTFADGQKPQALSGIKEADLPYKHVFKFNNSALYVSSKDSVEDSDESTSDKRVDKMFWNMGKSNYKKFVFAVESAQPKSLILTKKVLWQRQHLEAIVEDIERNIKISLIKMEQLTKEKKVLKQIEADIDRNKDFIYETREQVIYKKKIGSGQVATNCPNCQKTCHSRCALINEEIETCVVMKRDYCTMCPKRCHWRQHKSENFIYDLREEKVYKTLDDLKKRYENATGNKLTAEEVILECSNELKNLRHKTFDLVQEARHCLEHLREIALKPNPLSATDYIDLMIEEEQFMAAPGWKQSVKQLQKVKAEANIMNMLQVKQGELVSKSPLPERREDNKPSIFDYMYLSLRVSEDEPS